MFERQSIAEMAGYVPGAQPDGLVVAKLNTNENPFPPAPAVMAALRDIPADALRRYPDPVARGFRQAAAALHGVAPEHIIATNGGDELLRLAFTTFLDPGGTVGIAEPSYSLYPVLAAIQDCRLCRAPLADDWSLASGSAAVWNAAGARLAILVNPHAPSGRLSSAAELAAVAAAFRGVLLIDEAYVDFVDPARGHDTLALIRDLPNVLLLRTMSKGYSLAGLRFAYGIGAAPLIAPMLTKTKDSYNVDAISQRLAETALRHHGHAAEGWATIRAERARLARELGARGFDCAASETNFLLATAAHETAGGAEALYRGLAARGIFVRWFDQDRLRHRLRITIGTPDENDALLAAVDALSRQA
ncbi:pyridoxal phosphate-dependent aminotransferase [Phreatobacter stygius]|uniref:pyridoxal phosphate-dependent aminotransferase n=1 Tax=Phreatobacter stygius TaxID=1940610 RepID=UPI001C06ABD3|nr:aminotransferase class I/II-fold pyridoxal phosphate-dependent enzyme [Phreatobacter stygius]